MPTVHELTERFNQLVEQARERGRAGWAKVHRSDFSSRAVAEGQIARLERDLGSAGTTGATPGPVVVQEEPLRTSVPWTTEMQWAGGRAEHKSMAPDWRKAGLLALGAVRSDGIVPLDVEGVTLTVRRG